MVSPPALPQSADGVLKLAAQSMFDLFAQAAMGMMVVDREHASSGSAKATSASCPRSGFSATAISSASVSRRWCPTR